MRELPFFPEQASTFATRIDGLFLFIVLVTGFVFVAVTALLIYFSIKYHDKKHPVAARIHGNVPVEVTWSILPMFIFLIFFFWGGKIYMDVTRPPANALQIHVIGKQWMWKIQHPGGQREIDELHVPVGRPVQLTLISQDVIHDFFVPAFRMKWDVLPGRYRTIWFQATQTGKYHLFCSQYCGTQHSKMIGWVYVMQPMEYQNWLAQSHAEGSLADEGLKLFQDYACITCHRADSTGRAPNLVGLYGQTVYLEDGSSLIADDNYIRESILQPGVKIVAGYRNIMPVFQGQLSEEQIVALIEYIKSIRQIEQTQPLEKRQYAPAGPRPDEAPLPSTTTGARTTAQ